MLKNVLNAITKLFDLGKSLQGQSGVSQAVASMRAPQITQATKTGRVIELDKPGDLQAQAAKDLAQAVKDMRQANKERIAELRKPLSERIEELSLQERFDRLKAQGQLLGRKDVSRRLGGIRKPTQEQVVIESEKQEQRNRARMAEELEGRLPAAPGKGGIRGALGKIASHPVGATAALVAGLVVATKAVKAFAERTLEGSRELEQYNASIAASFARLEFQRQVLAVRTGKATQYSQANLARAVRDLRETMTPMKNAWISIKNTLATSLANGLNEALTALKLPWLLEQINRGLEAWNKRQQDLLGKADQFTQVGHAINRIAWDPMAPVKGIVNQPPEGRP